MEDLSNPAPVSSWPFPQAGLVLAIGTPGQTYSLIDGIGIWAPPTGATLGPDGAVTVPGFVRPEPAHGVSLTLQAVDLDPSALLGFTLTWSRFPDVL